MKHGIIRNTFASSIEYWCFGMRHRSDGPAVIYDNGGEEWYLNDKMHRVGGPALSGNDALAWVQNGSLHRTDGPAYVHKAYGVTFEEYWINGHQYSETEFNFWSALTEEA